METCVHQVDSSCPAEGGNPIRPYNFGLENKTESILVTSSEAKAQSGVFGCLLSETTMDRQLTARDQRTFDTDKVCARSNYNILDRKKRTVTFVLHTETIRGEIALIFTATRRKVCARSICIAVRLPHNTFLYLPLAQPDSPRLRRSFAAELAVLWC